MGKTFAAVQQASGHCLITADHGNVEQMNDMTTGQAHTAHTNELVPLVYIGLKDLKLTNGTLRDVAPTMLDLMNLTKPTEMTGESLIEATA